MEAVTITVDRARKHLTVVVISGAKQMTASGPTYSRLRRSFDLHRKYKLGDREGGYHWLSSHAGYSKYNISKILQLNLWICSAQTSGKTWKPWKPRNLFSWTSCERKNLTAKHFILIDELGGGGGGGGGGEGGWCSPKKILHAIHWFKKSTTEPPFLATTLLFIYLINSEMGERAINHF